MANKNFDIRNYFKKYNIDVNNNISGTVYKISGNKYEDESVHNTLWDVKSILIGIQYIKKRIIIK